MSLLRPIAFVIIAGVFGASAIAAGAFSAHGLEALRGNRAVSLWSLASQYQLIHAVVLVGVAILAERHSSRLLAISGALITLGVLLFCGALYLLGWFGPSALGAVAPLGGICLMAGWLMLAVLGVRQLLQK